MERKMLFGIITGLVAAFCQSLSYIFSKRFIHHNGNSLQLLIVSHITMGVMGAVVFAGILMYKTLPPLEQYLWPLIKTNGFYLLAQLSFFIALKSTEASRLSPLLGLKILFIAVISTLFFNADLTAIQWVGVGVCLAGAVMSNWSGGSIPLKSIFWILFSCLGYSLSDINIKILVDSLAFKNTTIAALTSGAMCYTLNGGIAALAYFVTPGTSIKQFKPAMPFSVLWFGAMLFLFTCFGFIGPVFGNIVQSSRGIISVVLGLIIAKIGYLELEPEVNRVLFIQRIAAAILITVAVILFTISP
jgi:drug/metabolite transporter (DMT)-like permease